jgi:type II secretory pathway component PulJ
MTSHFNRDRLWLSHARRSSPHRTESSKHQHPTSRQAPITKLQGFGVWKLGFLWSLDVGAWNSRRHRSPVTSHSSRAFTLIELVISSSLMAMILVSGYLCLNAAIRTQKQIEPRIAVMQNARVAMSIITADLRAACTLSKDCTFLGSDRMLGDVEADSVDFATHNYTPKKDSEGDFCEESFFLSRDPKTKEYVLYRRRNPLIAYNSFRGGKTEELARGLLGLRLEYFDGLDWWDDWGEIKQPDRPQSFRRQLQPNLEGLPQAVRITMWFDADSHPRTVADKPEAQQPPANNDNAPDQENASQQVAVAKEPLVFQSVVPLELASAPERSAGGGDNGGNTSGGNQNTGIIPGTEGINIGAPQ